MIPLKALRESVETSMEKLDGSFSLVAIDIDFFIRYSMRLPPEHSDYLMDLITSFLCNAFSGHCVFHLKKMDEFFAICRHEGKTSTRDFIEDVRKRFRRERFASFLGGDYNKVRLTFSAGIASYPDNGSCHEVYCKAYTALLAAKAFRRNQIVVYEENPPVPKDRHLYSPQADISVVVGRHGIAGLNAGRTSANKALMWEPQALAVSSAGDLYIADQNNHQILHYDGRFIKPVLGTGAYGRGDGQEDPLDWKLNKPTGLCIQGNYLYVTDTGNDVVVELNLITQRVQRICGCGQAGYDGDGGAAAEASLNKPGGIAADRRGNLYINDIANNIIRIITRDKKIDTFAGNGHFGFTGDGGDAREASFYEIYGIGIDKHSNCLYLADYWNHRIRHIDLATRIITTVAGCGEAGYSGDNGDPLKARLDKPVAVCASGQFVFIAESGNHSVRVIDRVRNSIYTLAGGCGMGTGINESIVDFKLSNPNALAAIRNSLYILDGANNRLCTINNWKGS